MTNRIRYIGLIVKRIDSLNWLLFYFIERF